VKPLESCLFPIKKENSVFPGLGRLLNNSDDSGLRSMPKSSVVIFYVQFFSHIKQDLNFSNAGFGSSARVIKIVHLAGFVNFLVIISISFLDMVIIHNS